MPDSGSRRCVSSVERSPKSGTGVPLESYDARFNFRERRCPKHFVSELRCKRGKAGSNDSYEGSTFIGREGSMSFGAGGGACTSVIP